MGKRNKIDLPKELMVEMYKTLSLEQIATELGVHIRTVQRRFKEYELVATRNPILLQGKKKRKPIKKVLKYKNKEDFQLYYSTFKSLVLVAKHYNISPTTALHWKQKHQIETILGASEQGKERINEEKPWANREELSRMYDIYSSNKLAEIWGCDKSTICDWLKRFDIPIKTSSEQWKRESKNSELILDGELNVQVLSTYKLRLSHKIVAKIKDKVGKCQSCEETEVLDLHHINEDATDNRPENHVILCPTCHAKIHRLHITVEELCPSYVSWKSYAGGHE
jgi:transposase/uncharacterized protein YlaI